MDFSEKRNKNKNTIPSQIAFNKKKNKQMNKWIITAGEISLVVQYILTTLSSHFSHTLNKKLYGPNIIHE